MRRSRESAGTISATTARRHSCGKSCVARCKASGSACSSPCVRAEVAGYIHAEDYDVLYFETMKNILGLAVAANHRRKGIGTKLLGAVEDWARETGVRQIRLNSGITRRGAHAFYRANGYTDEKEQKRFIKTLEA